MICFCCGRAVGLARKAKVRRAVDYDPASGGPESAAYQSYVEESTYRWAVLCPGCYLNLDNEYGLAEIGGRVFTMAESSRGDKARTLDEGRYREWQRKEPARLGLDPEGVG